MKMVRRRWMAAFGLALTTAACGTSDTTGAGQQASPIKRAPVVKNEFTPVELEATVDNLVAEINKGSLDPMQMTVLLKGLSGFFAPIATGASRAMGELGVTGNVVGSLQGATDQKTKMENQSRQIEQTVMDGAEGIGVSAFGEGNRAAIDAAVAAGVDVVTLDTDVASSTRSIYVGTINDAAGAAAGKTLLERLPSGPGTVVIHGNLEPSWVDGIERTKGARRVLEDAGYRTVVRSVSWTAGGQDADVAWMKTEIETAEPPVVGLLGLHDVSFWCAMAAEAAQRTDLPVVAFDFNPKTIDYMRKGRIQATHVQRQYYQGYLVPYVLYGIKTIGLEATKKILAPQLVDDSRFNLGLDVVPANKVDEYNAILDEIGAGQ